MIYFPSPNLAFFHLHKTGGVSFKHALRTLFPECIELDPWPHHAMPYYFGKLRELRVQPEKVEILTLIRDPLDHIVSIYHYWRQWGNPDEPKVQAAKTLPFPEFVVYHVGNNPGGRGFQRPLCVDDQLPPNVHILRLENWRADLDRLNYPWGPQLQLPHLNSTEHGPAATYHTAETIRLIRQRYEWIYQSGFYPDPVLIGPA
jgi:hypothetical protein